MEQRKSSLVALPLAIALAVLAGCRAEPRDPEQQASQALRNATLDHVETEWSDEHRVLRLHGTVGSVEERTRAGQVAGVAVGTAGVVANELGIEGMEARLAAFDEEIRAYLQHAFDVDPQLRERDIDFTVRNGTVTVTGSVDTLTERDRVLQIARSAPNVRDVANALRVERARAR